jgi:acyl-CoA reductase-like NAD-dependent aldehyde dehydrogenase
MTQAQRLTIETTNAILVRNPFDGSPVGEVPTSSAGEIAAVVARAKVAQWDFRRSTPAVRRAMLNALATEIAADAENLARIISSEMGKTIREARNEVRRAQNTLRLSGDAATFLDGEALHCAIVEGGADRLATITYEPVGVVGAITPFNYPLNLLCHKLGPAIAAGNGLVAKPSPKAPLAAARLRELALKAGWPKDLFQVVHGGADEALALVRAPIDLLSFTGGPSAGLALKNASGLVRCLMGARWQRPAFRAARRRSGQGRRDHDRTPFRDCRPELCRRQEDSTCTRISRRRSPKKLLAAVDAVEFGDPSRDDTDMGTVIDMAAARTVADRVEARSPTVTASC